MPATDSDSDADAKSEPVAQYASAGSETGGYDTGGYDTGGYDTGDPGSDTATEAVPDAAVEPAIDRYPDAALRRQAAAIVLRRRGLADTYVSALVEGSCNSIEHMGGEAGALGADAYNFCDGVRGMGTCDYVADPDLRWLCADPPGWCNSIQDYDLRGLCEGVRSCGSIQDTELRALCEQIP